jgi:hypothetical protein
MKKYSFCLVIAIVMVTMASCAPNPPKGTITITAQFDISAKPYNGTFEVIEGAEILGCESGSQVDTLTASRDFSTLSCGSGERSGTFTIDFDAPDRWMEEVNGPWTINEGTDDFSGLSGGGDFQTIFDFDEQSGVVTYTGEIQFSE